MSQQRYTPEFKDEAGRQVTERGPSVQEVAARITRLVERGEWWCDEGQVAIRHACPGFEELCVADAEGAVSAAGERDVS